MGAELEVKVRRVGPDLATVERVSRSILTLGPVAERLKRTRHRLLSFELVRDEAKRKRVASPKRYRATIYDYTNNRTLVAEGLLRAPKEVAVTELSIQPRPNYEEFQAAVKVVSKDEQLGPLVTEQRLHPYRPMPPLVRSELPDGGSERVVAVGLLPTGSKARHEIVGVDMHRRSLVRFEERAPPGAVAHNPICGLPAAVQATSTQGTVGSYQVTVQQGGTTLWKLTATRPSDSTGTNGSGIELSNVEYRGKSVLAQAHVPILNVSYDADVCGPYLDWQYEEGMFVANGTSLGPGFIECPSPPQTILDSGNDVGNFKGVAIYKQGQELVLVSELEAGWYRYISEWRFDADGTIRPRFGFEATSDSCVCTTHYHHVYWRLDFDIETDTNNAVREYTGPPFPRSGPWRRMRYEASRPRDPARNRHWIVNNIDTDSGYMVVPGPDDGVATASPDWPFPRGDVWVLRYNQNEIDFGINAPVEADLDSWVDGEVVAGQDVVLWYGAHFTHEHEELPIPVPVAHPLRPAPPFHPPLLATLELPHVVGPTLTPVNW